MGERSRICASVSHCVDVCLCSVVSPSHVTGLVPGHLVMVMGWSVLGQSMLGHYDVREC